MPLREEIRAVVARAPNDRDIVSFARILLRDSERPLTALRTHGAPNVNNYRQIFRDSLSPSVRQYIDWEIRQAFGRGENLVFFQVHHSIQQGGDALAAELLRRGPQINVHAPGYLYYVPDYVHREITSAQNAYRQVLRDANPNRLRGANNTTIYSALTETELRNYVAFSEGLLAEYRSRNVLLPVTAGLNEVHQFRRALGLPAWNLGRNAVNESVGGAAARARWALGYAQRGRSFGERVRQPALRGLVALPIVFATVSGGQVLANISNPNADAQRAYDELIAAYEQALARRAPLTVDSQEWQNLVFKLDAYLTAIGVEDRVRAAILQQMLLQMGFGN
jgi:hypothetical protein